MSREGSKAYMKDLEVDYAAGDVAYAFALEHLGTKEILPVPRDGKTGFELEMTGQAEQTSWFVAEDHKLMADTVVDALQRRDELKSMSVLPGLPRKGETQPGYCSLGGLGTISHRYLIPTMAMISGPWSLWAPSFGSDALDFDRMYHQLLAVGDVILTLDDKSRDELAGPYAAWRETRAQGEPTCVPEELPDSQEAPL